MNVLSFGGGVNSTAMLLELHARGEKVDLVLFADTGGERPETYQHVDAMEKWCFVRGIEFVHVSNAGRGQGKSLEENCLMRKELPSLAYGFKGCSVKWKRQPMDRYLRDHADVQYEWECGRKVVRYIGIDADEEHRTKLPPDAMYVYRYPLVEWGWGRKECIEAIRKARVEVPPKSSCFFCPATRRSEILELAEDHPDLFKRAVAIERNAVTHTVSGLGREWRWEDLVNADRRQLKLFPPVKPCDCMDGGDDD